MSKFVGGIVAGFFVGALAVEILGRTHPRVLERIEEGTFNIAGRIWDVMGGRRVQQKSRY